MRVLLLEDELDLLALVGAALEAAGFAVDKAKSIAIADAAANTTRYDLAILDRRLPDGDGLDC